MKSSVPASTSPTQSPVDKQPQLLQLTSEVRKDRPSPQPSQLPYEDLSKLSTSQLTQLASETIAESIKARKMTKSSSAIPCVTNVRYTPPGAPSDVLRFTPYAWSKLLFLRDHGDTEIGGFGVSSEKDALLVEDILMVKQKCTSVTVEFDDEAVADFFEEQVKLGRKPASFARIWIHTHPGSSAHPSSVDEDTFLSVFGNCHWAIMFILAKGGETYTRLQYNVGPKSRIDLKCDVSFTVEFKGSDPEAWKAEYEKEVTNNDSWLYQPSSSAFLTKESHDLNDWGDKTVASITPVQSVNDQSEITHGIERPTYNDVYALLAGYRVTGNRDAAEELRRDLEHEFHWLEVEMYELENKIYGSDRDRVDVDAEREMEARLCELEDESEELENQLTLCETMLNDGEDLPIQDNSGLEGYVASPDSVYETRTQVEEISL